MILQKKRITIKNLIIFGTSPIQLLIFLISNNRDNNSNNSNSNRHICSNNKNNIMKKLPDLISMEILELQIRSNHLDLISLKNHLGKNPMILS